MNSTESRSLLITGGGGEEYPSRASERRRSCVSRRWAATSFTFHFGAIVCRSHSSADRDFNNAIRCASSEGKRSAVRIGTADIGVQSFPRTLATENTEDTEPHTTVQRRSPTHTGEHHDASGLPVAAALSVAEHNSRKRGE